MYNYLQYIPNVGSSSAFDVLANAVAIPGVVFLSLVKVNHISSQTERQ